MLIDLRWKELSASCSKSRDIWTNSISDVLLLLRILGRFPPLGRRKHDGLELSNLGNTEDKYGAFQVPVFV